MKFPCGLYRLSISILFALCFSSHAQTPAAPGAQDEAASRESQQVVSSFEKQLLDVQRQIDYILSFQSGIAATRDSLQKHLRSMRLVAQERRFFFEQTSELLKVHDTATLPGVGEVTNQYWTTFLSQISDTLGSSYWNIEDDLTTDYQRTVSGLRELISRLGEITHIPYFGSAVNLLLGQVADNGLSLSGEHLEQLKQQLTSLKAGSENSFAGIRIRPLNQSIQNLIATFSFFDEQLLGLEKALAQFDANLAKSLAGLNSEIGKVQSLIESVRIIQHNITSLEQFDPGEVRQQLVFLKNQNRIKNYPHRILQSYDGRIETAIASKQWLNIVKAISTQDPAIGPVEPEKHAYLLYIGVNDLNKLYLIHHEHGEPSDYLYAIEDMLVVWLEDNPYETYDVKMTIELLKSEFESTFASFKQIRDHRGRGIDDRDDPTFFYYGVTTLQDINSPAMVDVVLKQVVKSEESTQFFAAAENQYKIHEKSYMHVSAGLAAGYREPANFVVNEGRLALSPAGEQELDDHLYALLNIHLGARDIDRFGDYPLFHPGKLLLQGGFALAKNPLDKLYAGLGFRLLKEVQLDLLYFWSREPDRKQTVALANAATVEAAEAAFRKVYRGGNFAIGISVYPQRIFGLLGM